MRPAPADLERLRAAVAASEGWWLKGQQISDSQRCELPVSTRAAVRWGGDPNLVARLVEAEAARTETFR